jgi:hypothetical protein
MEKAPCLCTKLRQPALTSTPCHDAMLAPLGLGITIFRLVPAQQRSRAMGITVAVGSFGQFAMLPTSLGDRRAGLASRPASVNATPRHAAGRAGEQLNPKLTFQFGDTAGGDCWGTPRSRVPPRQSRCAEQWHETSGYVRSG